MQKYIIHPLEKLQTLDIPIISYWHPIPQKHSMNRQGILDKLNIQMIGRKMKNSTFQMFRNTVYEDK